MNKNEVIDGVGKDAPTVENKNGGLQSDTPYRCDLLDGFAILEIARVLGEGAKKYKENNWRLITSKEHLNHAHVHILADMAGDTQDDHLAHALCRMMMCVAVKHQEDINAYKEKLETDDSDLTICPCCGETTPVIQKYCVHCHVNHAAAATTISD